MTTKDTRWDNIDLPVISRQLPDQAHVRPPTPERRPVVKRAVVDRRAVYPTRREVQF